MTRSIILLACALCLGACSNDLSYLRPLLIEKTPKIIAHRGMHSDGTSENSLAALRNAMEAGFDGIELDVWMTADGELVVHHDEYIGGVSIQWSTYDDIKDSTLGNGETLPTFGSFIDTFKSLMDESPSRLVIEVKPHDAPGRMAEAVERLLAKVDAAGVSDRVEFISFSYDACRQIVAAYPSAMVGYLSGDKAPDELINDGIMCIDYEMAAYAGNPLWIDDAAALGMVSNVWTVNKVKDLKHCISLGVDCITTDHPAKLQEIIRSAMSAD